LEESNGGRLPRKPRCCPHARTAVPWRVEHDLLRHEQPVPCIGLGMEMRVAGEVVEWSSSLAVTGTARFGFIRGVKAEPCALL
jgi:hypothetical protein